MELVVERAGPSDGDVLGDTRQASARADSENAPQAGGELGDVRPVDRHEPPCGAAQLATSRSGPRGGGAAAASSAASWRRIAPCSSWSAGSARSQLVDKPLGRPGRRGEPQPDGPPESASIRYARSRSRSGCSATSDSSSPYELPVPPHRAPRPLAPRAREAKLLESAISARANPSNANSASGGPRHSSSASRSAARASGRRPRLGNAPEPAEIELLRLDAQPIAKELVSQLIRPEQLP